MEEIRGDKLREAVFANTANPEPEVKIEEEPVSWWEKVKHSALYGNKQKAGAAKSSNRNNRRQNKTGLLVAGVVGALSQAASAGSFHDAAAASCDAEISHAGTRGASERATAFSRRFGHRRRCPRDVQRKTTRFEYEKAGCRSG